MCNQNFKVRVGKNMSEDILEEIITKNFQIHTSTNGGLGTLNSHIFSEKNLKTSKKCQNSGKE